MGNVILISSGKGGVGKSTLCKHLARCLAKEGKKTLVIEVDGGFRSMDLLLGVSHNIVYDIKDVLQSRCTVETGIVHCEENLDYMPASMDYNFFATSQSFGVLLFYVRQKYSYILIDSGAGYTPWHKTLAPLVDSALIVTTPTFPATRAAAQVSLQLQTEGLLQRWLIINRIPKILPKSGVSDLDEVIDTVGIQLIGAVPEVFSGDPTITNTAFAEFQRISRRLQGEYVELLLI